MNHALIIDDNMIVSRAIRTRLEGLGFTSFDHTWTEEQAVAAAKRRTPTLVVIGDEAEFRPALGAARRIASEQAVPVLMVTGDPAGARSRLSKAGGFDGPFLLNQVEEAVAIASCGRSADRTPMGAGEAAPKRADRAIPAAT